VSSLLVSVFAGASVFDGADEFVAASS